MLHFPLSTWTCRDRARFFSLGFQLRHKLYQDFSYATFVSLEFQLRHISRGARSAENFYDGFLYGQKQLQKDFTKRNGRAQRGKNFTRLFTKRKAITKKFTLRAQREENISTHCTIHYWLAGTRVAGDSEIVKLFTLLRWLWFFAVILAKMQVWGTKKDALCTRCFGRPCSMKKYMFALKQLQLYARKLHFCVEARQLAIFMWENSDFGFLRVKTQNCTLLTAPQAVDSTACGDVARWNFRMVPKSVTSSL